MVEVGDTFHFHERFFRVTVFTVLSEFSLVRVGVAGIACRKTKPRELLEFLTVPCCQGVAFDTLDLTMQAMQLKPGRTMAEARCRLEGFGIVTAGTILRKCFLVVIGMAVRTCRTKSQIGEFLFSDRGICNVLGFVAIGTTF